MNLSEYTTYLTQEPSYYGSDCTDAQAAAIVKTLRSQIETEFTGIDVREYHDGQGSGSTTGPDEEIVSQIDSWIQENWTAAL